MRYALGVDGGNSKTHAIVIEETGNFLGFGVGGSGNHQQAGLGPALYEIDRAVKEALHQASIQSSQLEFGCFCLAGADLKEDYLMLQNSVGDLSLARSISIKNDTMAALRSGLTHPWGVVVICGAGFNAAGVSPGGREIILPGLGPISGDWGGGYELSQEMIRMIMRAWDGRGRKTLLTKLILAAVNLNSIEELLSKLYHQEIDYQNQLDLVPLLFEASEAGDEVARDLIVRMGTEVGITAKALIRRLSLERDEVEVVLAGSVFKGKGSLLFETVKHVVGGDVPKARIKRPKYEPVVGAALLALEAMNVTADETIIGKLDRTLPEELKLATEEFNS
jgi:N-acetylglucosamine kinase-like BadF-type ATPase